MTQLIQLDSLAGGISQQPPHLRLDGQAEDSQNVVHSTSESARKRHGTEIIAEVATTDPNSISPSLSGTDYRLHPLERDGSERYLMIYGDSTVRIFDEQGNESTVTISTEAEAYLDSGSADENEIKLRSYADTTFLLNTTVAIADAASPTYDLKRVFPEPSDVFSFTGAPSVYVRAERDDDTDRAGHFRYTMNGQTSLTYGRWDGPIVRNQWSQAYSGKWDDAANQPCGFRVAFARRRLTGFTGGDYNHTIRTVTSTNAFTGYTFRAGDMIYITSWGSLTGSPTANAWFEIESKTDASNIVLRAAQVNTLPTSTDTGQVNANDSASKCRIGREIEVSFDFAAETITDMHDIAAVLEREMRAANADNMCCVWVAQPGGGGQFQITGPYRSEQSATYQPTSPTVTGVIDITNGTDEPFYTGTETAGTGTLSTNPDTTSPASRWTRVAAPDQAEAVPDAETMPCAILRTAADTFDIDVIEWNARTSGDEVSNPIPSPFTDSESIADLTLHRNRLWLLAGDRLVSSQDGDLYNFFLEDAANQVDSDPIDITYGGDESPVGQAVVPFRRALTIFTEAGRQYDLAAPEAFTPTSVSVTPTTRLHTLNVQPSQAGNLMYFIASLEDRAALFEYFYDDIAVASAVTNVGNHVPDLVPTTAKTIAAHQNTGTVYVLPEVGNEVLVYRAEFDGSSKRLSAWGRIVMDGTIQIIDIAVLGDRLFLFTTAAGYEYVLEAMPIGRETNNGTIPYAVHYDRRVSLTGTYDSGNSRTEFVLPIEAAGSTINAYVEEDGTYATNPGDGSWKYGTADGLSSDMKIAVPGDLSGQTIVLGRFYTASLQLSRPYPTNERGARQIGSRITIIQMAVTHIDTGAYSVTSSSTNRTDRVSTFSAGDIEVDAHGHSRHILSADPDRTTITLSDTSPRPLVWAGIQFEADGAEMGALL